MCLLSPAREVVQVPESDPIIAYRAYGIIEDVNRLRPPVMYGTVERVTEADQEPTQDNRNGIYAYASPTLLANNQGFEVIWAVVKLWGQVVKHADDEGVEGYRAQFASPVRLHARPSCDEGRCPSCDALRKPETLAAIAEHYGVEWVEDFAGVTA
jgi:hypothetical protein